MVPQPCRLGGSSDQGGPFSPAGDYNAGMTASSELHPAGTVADLPADFSPTAPAAPALTSAERSALRAQAHGLSPVVLISESGLTPNLIIETDRALSSHGLIKVRVFGDDREARAEIGAALCSLLGCAPVQSIGKLLVLWRPQPESQKAQTPVRRRKPAPTKRQAAEGKTVGTPRKSRKTPTATPDTGRGGLAQRSPARVSASPFGAARTAGAAGAGSSARGFGAGGRAIGTAIKTGPGSRPTTPRSKTATGPSAVRVRQAPSRIARGAVNPSARPKSRKTS